VRGSSSPVGQTLTAMALPRPVRLTDGRVALRPPELRNVPAITDACQDAEIGRWTRVPRPYRKEHARAWIEAQPEEAAVGLLVVGADSDELLGSVGLVEVDLGQRRAEVALRLRPAVVVPRMTPARASTTARSRRLSSRRARRGPRRLRPPRFRGITSEKHCRRTVWP